jgi:hypothetical protein
MKQTYLFILTVITTAFVLGLAMLKINEACGNSLFSIPEQFAPYVNYAVDYGAMTLLCLFAFGGLAGKVVKVILGILIILAIVGFVIATVAPQIFHNIATGSAQIFANLL